MMKIKIFSSWCSSTEAKKHYEDVCFSHEIEEYGKNYVLTDEDDYTHAIIFNTAMPQLNIPKENVIGLAHEPIFYLQLKDTFINYAEKYIGKYLIGDIKSFTKPFIEQYSFVAFSKPLRIIPEKTKQMSIILSEKQQLIGHKYRHLLVQRILKTNLPIDIYGRGCRLYKDHRVKGNFVQYEPYLDYKFHICIENCRSNNIFSEKIINPLFTNTVPIYLGCYNIDKYFGDSQIIMSGNLDDDMKLITNIINNNEKYTKNIDQKLVDSKVNLLKNIPNLFPK